MTRFAWLLCSGLLFAGCGGGPDPAPDASSSGAASDRGVASGHPTAPQASAPSPPRGPYAALPDMGDARAYFQAHGQRTLVDRGYFRGDVVLAGPGLTKEGEGPGESVIDGDLTLQGDGWTLRGLTITGNVTVTGERNDLSACEVLGRVSSPSLTNKLPPGK